MSGEAIETTGAGDLRSVDAVVAELLVNRRPLTPRQAIALELEQRLGLPPSVVSRVAARTSDDPVLASYLRATGVLELRQVAAIVSPLRPGPAGTAGWSLPEEFLDLTRLDDAVIDLRAPDPLRAARTAAAAPPEMAVDLALRWVASVVSSTRVVGWLLVARLAADDVFTPSEGAGFLAAIANEVGRADRTGRAVFAASLAALGTTTRTLHERALLIAERAELLDVAVALRDPRVIAQLLP
jgi:hypothetical protein